MDFKIAALPSHFFIFYLVKITKIGLSMCSFKICDYFWTKTSVYVCPVYIVWILEGLSNSPMFLSLKGLLKMPFLYGKWGLSGLFLAPLYDRVTLIYCVENEFNPTSEVQNIENGVFQNAPFENGRFPNGGYSCLWAIFICLHGFF